MEQLESTKTACPSDWTPYDFRTRRVDQERYDRMRTATCQCGQLGITVEGEPAMVTACNCTRCQRRSGSAFSLSSRWSSEQVTNRFGDSSTFTRRGASGGNVQCVFCPRCGSTISTSLELFPGLIGIPVGCFADPSFPAPQVAAWCDSKFGWVRFPEGLVSLRDQSLPIET